MGGASASLAFLSVLHCISSMQSTNVLTFVIFIDDGAPGKPKAIKRVITVGKS